MDSLATPAALAAARHVPRAAIHLNHPCALSSGGRVRIVRGPLSGLTGILIEQDISSAWLVQADYAEGVFVRAGADAVELL